MTIERLLPESVIAKELAFMVAYRNGERANDVYSRMGFTIMHLAFNDCLKLISEIDGKVVTNICRSVDLTKTIEAFADEFLLSMANEFNPNDPTLGLWAQYCDPKP